MEYTVSENLAKKRFEIQIDGQVAFIEYIRAEVKMYLTHTEVPTSLEGQGIGSALVRYAFSKIFEEKRKLVPLCPFVAAYLKRHPEHHHLLAAGYSV